MLKTSSNWIVSSRANNIFTSRYFRNFESTWFRMLRIWKWVFARAKQNGVCQAYDCGTIYTWLEHCNRPQNMWNTKTWKPTPFILMWASAQHNTRALNWLCMCGGSFIVELLECFASSVIITVRANKWRKYVFGYSPDKFTAKYVKRAILWSYNYTYRLRRFGELPKLKTMSVKSRRKYRIIHKLNGLHVLLGCGMLLWRGARESFSTYLILYKEICYC